MAVTRWTKTVGSAEITKISVGEMDNNVYLLASGDEVLLVDGGSNEADAVLAAVGDRTPLIFQTHNHGDHVVTLPEVVERTGARVLAHPADALGVEADHVDEGDIVEVGDVSGHVLHTPGHTPGGICLVVQEAGETHVFAGDTLFPGGPGNTFGNADAFKTLLSSIETKLFALPDDANIYPGHGDDTTIGAERGSLESWRERGW